MYGKNVQHHAEDEYLKLLNTEHHRGNLKHF